MNVPVESELPPAASPDTGETPQIVLSPEDQDELDAFRRMATISREVTARRMAKLIRRGE